MGTVSESPIRDAPEAGIVHVEGTAAQRTRNLPALEWLTARRAAYESLSIEERERLEGEWRAFRDLMNDSRSGQRKLYP